MSEAAAAAIERLREKLIDLSASNRLINFRHGADISGSQSVLLFVGKSPNQLFARLQDQKNFIFQPVPAPTERELRDFYREPGSVPGLEGDDARNRTRPEAARWAKYLGWDVDYELPVETDDGTSGGDHRPYQAPLVLLPATIDTTTSARGTRGFTISWTGEDLQPNLSLKRKLAIDFGIDLPEFSEEDSPDSYFDRVRHTIAAQSS
jgi:uncharacterized protein DUF4011